MTEELSIQGNCRFSSRCFEGAEEIRLFIKNYRINDALSQADFSEMADLHVNSLQRFEKGSLKNIKLLTLLSLIDATSMSLSEFFQTME
ncbi:MAG: helix-turn-helix transcriptional regulator [Candidatus Methanofastidiosa archaeon]|nr:helix-turn-helix transcriptional regulator [Candidatus Methanofastidiosa archaeon]